MTSTDIARTTGTYLALQQDPHEIQQIIAENLGGQEVGEFDLPRVKVPGSGGTTWELPAIGVTPPESTRELTGVVVHFKLTRAYWKPSDEMGGPPACRSHDSLVGVGDPGGQCKTCPLAQYGTATDDQGNPAPGQACSQKEIWFMLREGGFLPIVIALPATSLKAAKAYRVGQLGSAGIRLPTVVTKLELVADKNAAGKPYSRAVPSVAGTLDPEDAEKAIAYAQALRPTFDAAAEAINVDRTTDGE